jgi:NTE family protein
MKVSLCLSGGALRAAAQIGAWKFMEDEGVEIGAVSGSSAGAVVALFIAAGKRSDELLNVMKKLRKRDIFRLSGQPGLFSLDRLEGIIRESVGVVDHRDLKIPCHICVTEINTARTCYLDWGDPVANTTASCALSPIFSPRKIRGVWYVDGGFTDNLPVRPLKNYGLPILSLNVNPLVGDLPGNFRSLLVRSLLVMMHSNIIPSRRLSDAHLDIDGVARMNLFDFSEIGHAYRVGYESMKNSWPELSENLQT